MSQLLWVCVQATCIIIAKNLLIFSTVTIDQSMQELLAFKKNIALADLRFYQYALQGSPQDLYNLGEFMQVLFSPQVF